MRRLAKLLLARLLFLSYRLTAPFARYETVSIFAYHSISDAQLPTAITRGEFRSHLLRLKGAGYSFVSLRDIVAYLDEAALPRKAVALTFDDGYADFESAALPILEEFDAPATVFLVGDEQAAKAAVGNQLPLLQEEAVARVGSHRLVDIGYHALAHADLRTLSGEALRREVEPRFSARYFAYPGGNYSTEAVEAVRSAGYDAAFSIKPTLVKRSSDRFLLPRFVITKDRLLSDVRFYASAAASWYRAMTRSL